MAFSFKVTVVLHIEVKVQALFFIQKKPCVWMQGLEGLATQDLDGPES